MPEPTKQKAPLPPLAQWAFDWIDALGILGVAFALTIALRALGVDVHEVPRFSWYALLAVPIARRALFGVPVRVMKKGSSALGVLTTACIVFGFLIAGVGMLVLVKARDKPESSYAAMVDDPAERQRIAELEEQSRREHDRMDIGIVLGGLALLTVGGLLDRRRTRRDSEIAKPASTA